MPKAQKILSAFPHRSRFKAEAKSKIQIESAVDDGLRVAGAKFGKAAVDVPGANLWREFEAVDEVVDVQAKVVSSDDAVVADPQGLVILCRLASWHDV